MMASAIARRFDVSALLRLFATGIAWGLTLEVFFLAINIPKCGLPCLDDAAFLTSLCVATGWLTIGPFATFAGGL